MNPWQEGRFAPRFSTSACECDSDRHAINGTTAAALRPRTGAESGGRKTEISREILFVLVFCLMAFGWLMLIRHVRVGLPGDVSVPARPVDQAEKGLLTGNAARGTVPETYTALRTPEAD